jgi:esterase/lipase
MLLLAQRIAWIPNTWVEVYNWRDWVSAANRIWARKDARVVVVGYSGGGSRATWLANSVLHKPIDLIVTYDPSPPWQMQNLPPNVKKAITYQNQRKFWFKLGGGELTGPNVDRYQIEEEHLAVQIDERLHKITLHAIEELAAQ